jgi:hypothetical protein
MLLLESAAFIRLTHQQLRSLAEMS